MKTFFIFAIAIFLASCSTVAKKEGQATLQGINFEENGKRYQHRFMALDGKKLKLSYAPGGISQFFVDPGKRSLDLEINFKLPETAYVHWSTKFRNVVFEIEENEVYKIRSSVNNWCVKLEIINSSGVVVAGPLFSQPGIKDARLLNTIDEIKLSAALTYFRTQTCP